MTKKEELASEWARLKRYDCDYYYDAPLVRDAFSAGWEAHEKRAKILLDALEFYAQTGGMSHPTIKINDLNDASGVCTVMLNISTKTAREALEKYRSEEK